MSSLLLSPHAAPIVAILRISFSKPGWSTSTLGLPTPSLILRALATSGLSWSNFSSAFLFLTLCFWTAFWMFSFLFNSFFFIVISSLRLFILLFIFSAVSVSRPSILASRSFPRAPSFSRISAFSASCLGVWYSISISGCSYAWSSSCSGPSITIAEAPSSSPMLGG